MEKNSKIYVAGHLGLVGSALQRKLQEKGYKNIIGRSIDELNLMDYHDTLKYFETEKPEYVFLAAAKVGGIIANNTYRAQFIYENLQIQNNIIHSAYMTGVKKLLFLGSSCIYPKNAPQPLKEDYLLTSGLEYTNEPYAIAKIAGIKMAESYNIQYGTNFISVMPTNLFGPNDNYDLEKSHVLPAMIRKMHLANALDKNNWDVIRKDLNKKPVENVNGNSSENDLLKILAKYGIKKDNGEVKLTLWGTGNPKREFLHSDDMADACVFIMENVDFKDILKNQSKGDQPANEIKNTHINIGIGKDLTIRELAEIIKQITGFKGSILWDKNKPDGTMQKLLDVSKLKALGWGNKICLEDGIRSVYQMYIA
jgi:Nucleoside-diphosphate-sugar epimerases